MTELAVGERCGITVPTLAAFEGPGYGPSVQAHSDVKHYYFEEEPQVEIPLTHKAASATTCSRPSPWPKADFFVNLPQFSRTPDDGHLSMNKAYIGIEDDRHLRHRPRRQAPRKDRRPARHHQWSSWDFLPVHRREGLMPTACAT